MDRINRTAPLQWEPQSRALLSQLGVEALLTWTQDGIKRILYILLDNNTQKATAKLQRRMAPVLSRLNDHTDFLDSVAQVNAIFRHLLHSPQRRNVNWA